MRKQVLIIVSVALASFLIGTMFSTNYLASGAKPPSVWDAINALQARVNSLNNTVIEQQAQITDLREKLNSTKTMRFYEPDETVIEVTPNIGFTGWENASRVFTWSPLNSSNNAVLSIHFWFEYKTNVALPIGPYPLLVGLNMTCDGIQMFTESEITHLGLNYRYSRVATYTALATNCLQYQFWFQIGALDHTEGGPNWQAYVRNLNIVLTIVDGLPASG